MRNLPPETAARQLLPLLRELGDLKRIASAAATGSIATRLFASAWAGLAAGRSPDDLALRITAEALVATRLGDLDESRLALLGLTKGEALGVRTASLDAVAGAVVPDLRACLREALATDAPSGSGAPPPFVEALARQPRAGVTCPGRPRIVLQPAENHAEHCLTVAVYGVLLSSGYGADPGTVFLAALAHHLHNAAMPDSGFTGEVLLGPHLDPVVRRATEMALDELSPDLREKVVAARAILPDDRTAEGRAFHAADVLDRVLEIEQHLARARLTMDDVLGGMALVHEGPVKPFHDRVLAEAGLL